MTLSDGNALAKVKRNPNGEFELITGESQHIFEVCGNPQSPYLTDSGDTRIWVSLRVIE